MAGDAIQMPTAGEALDQWIERYARRLLSGEEKAAFELAMFEDPLLQERVEVELMLRDGLRVLQADAADGAASSRALSSAARSRLPLWLPLAASMVVGLGVGVLANRWQGSVPANDGGASPQIVTNVTLLTLDVMRGTAVATLTTAAGVVPLSLEIPDVQPGKYSLLIRTSTSPAPVLTLANLEPDAANVLRIFIAKSNFAVGDYVAELTGGGRTRSVPFRVQRDR